MEMHMVPALLLLALCVAVADGRGFRPQAAMVGDKKRLWPGGRVRWVIDTEGDPDRTGKPLDGQDPAILWAIREWESKTCIRFERCASRETCREPYMYFMKSGGGCSAFIGLLNQSRISFPDWCGQVGAVHEIGHVLGMHHEQTRLDRDLYVRVEDDLGVNHDQEAGFWDVGAYDYDSVMHYGAGDHLRLPEGVTTGRAEGLSPGDAAAVQFMYNKCSDRWDRPTCAKSVESSVRAGHSTPLLVRFYGRYEEGRRMTATYEGTVPTGEAVVRGAGDLEDSGEVVVVFTPRKEDAGRRFTLGVRFADSNSRQVSTLCSVEVTVLAEETRCAGLVASDPRVCSGHGTCWGGFEPHCVCEPGYGDADCGAGCWEPCAGGSVLREVWHKVWKPEEAAEKTEGREPTERNYVGALRGVGTWGNGYVERLRGYIEAPHTGDYFFWIAGSGYGCELKLSTGTREEDVHVIAKTEGSVPPGDFTKQASQQSSAVRLQRGQRYYVEVVHHAAYEQGDHVSVAWAPPVGSSAVVGSVFHGVDGLLGVQAALAARTPPQEEYSLDTLGHGYRGQRYGEVLRGTLVAPRTGQYVFWIAGDDQGVLRLSTDDRAEQARDIARHDMWTADKEWDKFSSQRSTSIPLVEGQRYYIEVVRYNGGGGDHLGVAWTTPGDVHPVPIPSEVFSPSSERKPVDVPASVLSPWVPGARWAVREGWGGVGSIDDLLKERRYPRNPTAKSLGLLQQTDKKTGRYAERIRATVEAPETGEYTFWIAGDDEARLLFGDETGSVREIARVSSSVRRGQWQKFPSQRSSPQRLVGGRRYQIEVLHAQDGKDDDFVEVAWTLPGRTSSWDLVPPSLPPRAALVEIWENVQGRGMDALLSDSRYPNSPSWGYREVSPSFSLYSPNHGMRVRFLVEAPRTGQWTFYIAGDEQGRLLVSTDETPERARKVAEHPNWTRDREWDKFPEQRSTPQYLVKGRRYYVEVLHYEGGGHDATYVGWAYGSAAPEEVPLAALHPFFPDGLPATTAPAHPTPAPTNPTPAPATRAPRTPSPPSPPSPTTSGMLLEVWEGLSTRDPRIESLTSDPRYPSNPTSSVRGASLNYQDPVGEGYGRRLRGYVTPPETDTYTFWIASDGSSRLLLSEDHSPVKAKQVAHVDRWTSRKEWTRFASQRSPGQPLQRGKWYYIEVLHVEPGGDDHLEVAWSWHGHAISTIPKLYLFPL